MQRHLIAFCIPPFVDDLLRNFYKKAFGKEILIELLHITILASFFLKKEVSENELKSKLELVEFEPIKVSLGPLGVFENLRKKILYVLVEPEAELLKLHEKASLVFKDQIKIDTSLYSDNQVPVFKPHISLEYDYTGSSDKLKAVNLPSFEVDFSLDTLKIYSQKDDQAWKEVNW